MRFTCGPQTGQHEGRATGNKERSEGGLDPSRGPGGALHAGRSIPRWRPTIFAPLIRLQQHGGPALSGVEGMALEQDRQIAEVVTREQSRLRRFIRRRVADPGSPSGKGWESWRCPHSLWRIRPSRRPPLHIADDAGGAGTIPPADPRALRLWPGRQREPGTVDPVRA